MNNTLSIIDIETDSNRPEEAHILEIALANLDLRTGNIELRIETLVRPDCSEDYWQGCWFINNSGVSENLIRKAPTFDSLRKQLTKEIQYPITAYNISFDFTILNRYSIEIPKPWPCLMLTCTPILQLPGNFGDYKWPKFVEAWNYFFPKEHLNDTHRAGPDAVNEAKLAFRLYNGGYLKDPDGN
jgi:DNA polymerase III epsilon subunit-like protein